MTSTVSHVQSLLAAFGPKKPMGTAATSDRLPHFFLHRSFLGDQDLLIILNTKRCRYHCDFCELPTKSSLRSITGEDIVEQFRYVASELKHSLSVLNRLTLSNEGSVLDEHTLPRDALLEICTGAAQFPALRRVVLETRLEFVDTEFLCQLRAIVPRATLDILTGFESRDEYIRDHVLRKHETLSMFLSGLDRVRDSQADLTAYVLFKPSASMTDEEAYDEATRSIRFIADECAQRKINFSIRLNPMYLAVGSKWEAQAASGGGFVPPRLTDVLRVAAEARASGIPVYIGLSTEGLGDDAGTYRSREDFSRELIRQAVALNAQPVSLTRTG
jgi:radical SAM enzyme (TIGR01210 family)